MEIPKLAESAIKDSFAIAKFVGERAIGGAWGLLARQVHISHEVKPANIQIYESNIERGEN